MSHDPSLAPSDSKAPSLRSVVVIGAAGRLGREFVNEALRLGHSVTAVARDLTKLREALKTPDAPSLTLAQADARDVEALASVIKGADAVLNGAGHAADGEAFTSLCRTVVQAAERTLGPGGRLWFLGGIGALRIPNTNRLGVELAGMPAMYQTHRINYETLRASALDWSMLCPGPLVDSTDRPAVEELRITTDILPVEIDVSDAPDDQVLFSRLRDRFPETTVPYATAAEVVIRHLGKGDRFSRQRVGIALPVGRTAHKPGWVIGQRG